MMEKDWHGDFAIYPKRLLRSTQVLHGVRGVGFGLMELMSSRVVDSMGLGRAHCDLLRKLLRFCLYALYYDKYCLIRTGHYRYLENVMRLKFLFASHEVYQTCHELAKFSERGSHERS